jgi:hypothetical protein
MEQKSTIFSKGFSYSFLTLTAIFFAALSNATYAQISCNNEAILWSENFGTGTTPTSNPDVITTGLTYQASGPLAAEGTYRVINSTQQKPEWQLSEDHTPGDVDGQMLVINGQAETFYGHQVDRTQGFSQGNYTVSLFIMNVDTLGTCGADALLPNINFRVEYLSQGGTWVPLSGSPYTAPAVPQQPSVSPTWVALGSSFTLPATGNFLVTSIRIILADGTVGGCGNDFAMDDIKFSLCPEGGQLPVTFLGINAIQKGSGVSVIWSTSQEFNSSRFDVEKSADGNTAWTDVSSVTAAGNSATVKNYNAFDANPLNGANYYRIRQVDKDGVSKYSKTVMVRLTIDKTGVSLLSNPFYSLLRVDFTSPVNQQVYARLMDITGKQVAVEKWTLSAGASTKEFSNVGGIQPGMYIINITSASGALIYNNKVIKQ